MPFAYYESLSRRNKAIYRRSDAVTDVILPDPECHRPAVERLREALGSGSSRRVQRAAADLAHEITSALGTAPVDVKVRTRRPRSGEGELHGLYEAEEGKRPQIQIWMRTASQKRVVAFRTFLRTLLHELCHHLDFAHYDLAETFHTEGFFRRESSLVRQLAPAPPQEPPKEPEPPPPRPAGPEQLELPLD